MIYKFVSFVGKHISKMFVKTERKAFFVVQIEKDKCQFKNHTDVVCIANVPFLQCNNTSGRMKESRACNSDKLNLYG